MHNGEQNKLALIRDRIVGALRGSTSGDWWQEPRKRYLVLGIVAVLVVGVFVIGVFRSVPGGLLFPIKADVIEDFVAGFQISDEARIRYRIGLLETRLSELKRMGDKGSVSEQKLDAAYAKTTEHVEEIGLIIEQNTSLPLGTVLDLMLDMSAVLRAEEQVAEESEVLDPLENRLEDLREQSEDTYGDLAGLYVVQTEDAELQQYIDARLSQLSEQTSNGSLDERTMRRISQDVEQFQKAVLSNDAAGALSELGDALRAVRAAAYFD